MIAGDKFGDPAMLTNFTGSQNTAIGYRALATTTGSHVLASGYDAIMKRCPACGAWHGREHPNNGCDYGTIFNVMEE